MWWDIFVNEHGAIISSMLALTTFAALFFLAYVLQKTLSPRKPPETATSDKKKTLPSGKPQPKKKKRKGGCSRINHRLGRTKSTSESHDGADRSPTRDESELGSTSTGLSSPTLPHQESQQRQEISQQNFSDNSPVYSSALKPSSDLPENVAHHHISPVSNSSISREGSLSTSTTESCRTPNTRQSSHGATDSTKSEDLQRDLARSAKGGNRAYSATQSNSQHAGRKKNTRRGTARKLSSNDTYSKQTYDAPNCQVGTGSQRDTLKSSLAVFRRTVESHERQGSNCSVSRSVSATKSRNSVRAFPTISSQNEIKSSQMSPSKEYARLSATSLANEMQPSRIVSPHPALHYPYHDGAPGVSFSQTNLAYDWSCQTKQRPAADTMDESRGRSRTDPGTSYSFVSNIPPPPGLSLPTGVNTNATIDMPLLGVSTAASIGGSSLPMVSTAQSHPYSLDLQEADLHDITMRRCLVKENPFEMSSPTMTTVVLDQNEEDRIDAELQELGGRMVGSILDF